MNSLVVYRQAPVIDRERRTFLLLAALCLLAIWGACIGYVLSPRQFDSELTLLLPNSSRDSRMSLETLGQASTTSKSAYGIGGISPTQIYKQIISSQAVRRRAAAQLGRPAETLPRAAVSLIQQTSLLKVRVRDVDPTSAEALAWAYHDSLQETLEGLREDELSRRSESVEEQLGVYRERLEAAKFRLLERKRAAALVSDRQFEALKQMLADLQRTLLDAATEERTVEAEFNSLAGDLGISPALVADAFRLQSDPVFQGLLEELAELNAQLPAYRAKWGERHPRLTLAQGDRDAVEGALQARSVALVGHRDLTSVELLTLAGSSERSELFSELIGSHVRLAGARSKRAELLRTTELLDQKVRLLLGEQAELEALERDVQVAEAVFVSAMTKVETEKADVFSVYPMTQLLSPPSLPEEASTPHVTIAVAGSMLGSLLVVLTFLLVWNRNKWLPVILKSK